MRKSQLDHRMLWQEEAYAADEACARDEAKRYLAVDLLQAAQPYSVFKLF